MASRSASRPGDVGEGQVTGLLVDAPRDQIRGERAHRERPARIGEQPRDRVQEPGPDAVVLDAHRDGADDPAAAVPQRHLAPGRAAQGAAVDLHDVAAAEGVLRIGGDDPADLAGVGVRPAHPSGVHDHHVLGARRPPDPLRLRLHRPPADGREASRSSATCGWAAVVAAMASARRMAWSSSWAPSGARKSPVASTATPAAMASCMRSTWEKTRRGQPSRRRRGVVLVGGAVMDRHVRRPGAASRNPPGITVRSPRPATARAPCPVVAGRARRAGRRGPSPGLSRGGLRIT